MSGADPAHQVSPGSTEESKEAGLPTGRLTAAVNLLEEAGR